MTKKLYTLILLLIINLSTGYAQQDFTCRGRIIDANTNLPLQDVRIYLNNEFKTQSNSNGEFQLSLKTGSGLLFKKSGYGWRFLKITNNDTQQIRLVPSDPEKSEMVFLDRAGNKREYDGVDFYFNGQLVPEAEWSDANGILNNFNPNEMELRVDFSSTPGRVRYIINTY
jgi:hypothetical protein